MRHLNLNSADSSRLHCFNYFSVENDSNEGYSQELSNDLAFSSPFVFNCCPNGTSTSVISATISSLDKDISLDNLDSPQSKNQINISTTYVVRSETFENILPPQTLQNITDNFLDSTSSTSAAYTLEHINDHFIDHDDSDSINSLSFETAIINQNSSMKPQKRLLQPGSLNRLILIRQTLSDSDLQQKQFYINGSKNQFHVYHSNVINEHSVQINLMNTYGSDSELPAWSHDCTEQRRFFNQREQQFSNHIEEKTTADENYDLQLAIERQILLQQIYEYPWLLQENGFERITKASTTNIEQSVASSSSDLILPSHNPDFYQLCPLTETTSFVTSYESDKKKINPSTTSFL